MTELKTYIERTIEVVASNRDDERRTALLVRALTREALARDSFLLACAERIISSIETSRGRWRNPPLHKASDPAVVMRIFYWPPGYRNDPHLHNAWTVTGVLENEIMVETFPEAAAPDAENLGPSVNIPARAGDTGYLLPPCIHRLHNTSSSHCATLHIFSKEEPHGKPAGQAPAFIPAEYRGTLPMNVRRSALCAVSALLARIHDVSAVELLQRIFVIGDSVAKLQAVKALLAHDVSLAAAKSRELESALQGRSREALARINMALASA